MFLLFIGKILIKIGNEKTYVPGMSINGDAIKKIELDKLVSAFSLRVGTTIE